MEINQELNLQPQIGVAVFIENEHGEFLLSKRKGSHCAGKYALPGGHLEFGETLEECCVREVFEETRLTIDKIEIWGYSENIFDDPNKGPLHYVTHYFRADVIGGILKNMEPEKHSDWKWFFPDNFPDNTMGNLRRVAYKNLLKRCKNGRYTSYNPEIPF